MLTPIHDPITRRARERSHRSFALVLAGGGARGLAHAGVLRALEHDGYRPSMIVGVSMGAIVAVTYASNCDWYEELLNFDPEQLPQHHAPSGRSLREQVRTLIATERMIRSMLLGWGIGGHGSDVTWQALERFTRGRRLEQGRIPVVAVATDLRSGDRVALSTGSAAEAAYASSALAGVQPPLEREGALLVDGGYSDLVPIDLARASGVDVVIAIDPGQPELPADPKNGMQAMLRAAEICHEQHARMRFSEADVVLRPDFGVPIHTLDFSHHRRTIVSGMRAVREARATLANVLRPGKSPTTPRRHAILCTERTPVQEREGRTNRQCHQIPIVLGASKSGTVLPPSGATAIASGTSGRAEPVQERASERALDPVSRQRMDAGPTAPHSRHVDNDGFFCGDGCCATFDRTPG